MRLIEEFVTELAKQKNSSTVSNPYLNQDIADNLRLYLAAMSKMNGRRILLVGEAPGYKGCKITGIPFTSGRVFERFSHPLLREIASQLKLSKVESENTATIVWAYFARRKQHHCCGMHFHFILIRKIVEVKIERQHLKSLKWALVI